MLTVIVPLTFLFSSKMIIKKIIFLGDVQAPWLSFLPPHLPKRVSRWGHENLAATTILNHFASLLLSWMVTCDAKLRNPGHGVSVIVGQGSTDLAYLGSTSCVLFDPSLFF
jgi:hypothetical protein